MGKGRPGGWSGPYLSGLGGLLLRHRRRRLALPRPLELPRALRRGGRLWSAGAGRGGLVALDEPTAAMGVREGGHILELLQELRRRNFAVLCISHNIPQILELADRLCILRGGTVVWQGHRRETSVEEVVARMSGVIPRA